MTAKNRVYRIAPRTPARLAAMAEFRNLQSASIAQAHAKRRVKPDTSSWWTQPMTRDEFVAEITRREADRAARLGRS